MLIFVIAFCIGQLFFFNSRIKTLSKILDSHILGSEALEKINDRISTLNDHMRSTEKCVYSLKDQLSKVGHTIPTDPHIKEQIEVIKSEIGHISSILLDILSHKPKNMVKECKTNPITKK
jgi:hypothetical protein